ncbi:MAG: hypothetical protein HQL09_06010 [Nitrospirae bacterium]|nr:hypothetical protein [Nitrospirota bacterium]
MLNKVRPPYFLACAVLILAFCSTGFALSDEKILSLQNAMKGASTGDRIAFFAEQFVGTPYDPDPLGAYVRQAVIVADEKIDCMYLVFRAVELALSPTPEGAVEAALERRFHSRGIISNRKVVNYDDRFAYGEDMVPSGKWGKEITSEIGRTVAIQAPRSGQNTDMLQPGEVLNGIEKLKSGDLLFFIKSPSEKTGNEIVGHLGIIERAGALGKDIYLIHASGRKYKGGIVKKIALREYIKTMPFIGIKITRFP